MTAIVARMWALVGATGDTCLAEEGVTSCIPAEDGVVVVPLPVTSLIGGEAVNPLAVEGVIASLFTAVNPLAVEGVIASLPVDSLFGERPVKNPLLCMMSLLFILKGMV
jgi:hypothetical protein